MSTQSINIVFRGLLVMHLIGEEGCDNSYFEIGVLPTAHHIPRINTIKNCVLASTTPLKEKLRPRCPFWRLVVDQPISGGVNTCKYGKVFDRQHHGFDEDFRWANDFNELFGDDVGKRIDTSILEPVLKIPHGLFYTRLKSPTLIKLVDGASQPFGSLAAVVGCRIPILGGGARLVEEHTGDIIFELPPEAHTIYEITNTPPDVEDHECHCCEHCQPCCHSSGEHAHAEGQDEKVQAPDQCEGDHFQAYYELFKEPDKEPRICFFKTGPAPAPDPALCGMVQVKGVDPFGTSRA